MAGTALSWFVWDFAFYGNKLFQSAFINAVIGGTPTLIQVCGSILCATVRPAAGQAYACWQGAVCSWLILPMLVLAMLRA